MEVWFRYHVFVLFWGWGVWVFFFPLFLGSALHKPDSWIWQVLFYSTYTATCTAERFKRLTSLLIKATTSKHRAMFRTGWKEFQLPFFILLYSVSFLIFMPYSCTCPMLFLHTVHLTCSPDTLDLFNNIFPALCYFAPACRWHDKEHTGTQAASGPLLCWAVSSLCPLTRPGRPRDHSNPIKARWCHLM